MIEAFPDNLEVGFAGQADICKRILRRQHIAEGVVERAHSGTTRTQYGPIYIKKYQPH
jgi:hypothetical protein